jgi:hypothetical protein
MMYVPYVSFMVSRAPPSREHPLPWASARECLLTAVRVRLATVKSESPRGGSDREGLCGRVGGVEELLDGVDVEGAGEEESLPVVAVFAL